MFRQIRISSEDTNWQRILWRDNPKETVKEYRLTTVTYGTSCAPYLSARTLTQLAFDEREEERCIYSKRDVLSEIARVFDPLGLLSPCIVFMKILLQELWKLNLEWDEPIPEDLNKQWTTFRKELHLIKKMKNTENHCLDGFDNYFSWLKTEPYRWQPFVANRVSKFKQQFHQLNGVMFRELRTQPISRHERTLTFSACSS
ncbi:integrase catalytic domain-containing protein [Trichonephila clavipes]|nr:integrase catalytic domain-containing protein [Trichonephila clavipes]